MESKQYYIMYGFKLFKGTILQMFKNFDLYTYDSKYVDDNGNFDYATFPQLFCVEGSNYEYFGVPILVSDNLEYTFNELDSYDLKRELYCLLSENNINLGYNIKPNLQIFTVWNN